MVINFYHLALLIFSAIAIGVIVQQIALQYFSVTKRTGWILYGVSFAATCCAFIVTQGYLEIIKG